MKKFLFSSAVLFGGMFGLQAQGQGSGSGGSLNANTQWKTTGNTAQSADFVGTTNTQPLIFKTNNSEAMRIDPTGKIIFSKLGSPNGDGIVIIGGGGEGGRIDFTHNFTHVLNGQGIFTDISTFTGLKVNGNNIIQTAPGNIGFGVSNPMAKVSVAGDGSFTGNLNIGGSILSNALTTNTLSVGTFSGTNASFLGTLSGNNVIASSLSTATLDVSQSILFAGSQSGLGFIPPSGNNAGTIYTQKGGPPSQVNSFACTVFPNIGTNPTFSHNGMYQSYYYSNSNIGVLSMGYDGANGSIDVAGINQSGYPGLLLNYYCGNDVHICTNPGNGGGANSQGGVVRIGENLEVGLPIRDLNSTLNLKAWGANALKIADNGNRDIFYIVNDGSTRIKSWSATASPFSIDNNTLSTLNKNLFEVASTGLTTINVRNSSSTPANALLINDYTSGNPIINFMVKTNGQVYGREVIVSLNQFPDYVFASDYKLMPLSQVKKYTEINHRLPNMPSAQEVETNGANLGEIQRVSVEKIEELYKYIFELEQRTKALEEELKKLKSN